MTQQFPLLQQICQDFWNAAYGPILIELPANAASCDGPVISWVAGTHTVGLRLILPVLLDLDGQMTFLS